MTQEGQMSRRRLTYMITMGIKQFRDPYYQGFAAQLAFYFLLAVVPTVMIISQIIASMEIISMDRLVQIIDNYLGQNIPDALLGLLKTKSATTSNIIFIVVALWAASRAQFSMIRITNYTMTDGKTTGAGYFRERLRSIVTMLFTVLIIIVTLIVLIFGPQLLMLIGYIFGNAADVTEAIAKVWIYLRWAVAFILFLLVIGANYYMLPTQKVPFKTVIPGSIFASVGLVLISVLYARYATSVANYDIIYGSLASIAMLMIWFYFVAWVLCLGVLFNKVWDKTKNIKEEDPDDIDRYEIQ